MFAVPLTALIIVRDALLVGAGFYVRYISLAPPVLKEKFDDLHTYFFSNPINNNYTDNADSIF